NSDLVCLQSHIYFRAIVEQLTGPPANKLQSYELTEEQWLLAGAVEEVLLLFQNLTDLFSQAEVPLIVEALPMLEVLEVALEGAREDADAPNVVCVAAQAALLLLDKYSVFTNECELYQIAIGKL
ncbi:hypothetical protein BDQ12DRAFT_607102, partial [Crucibulum laeve]